MRSHCRVSLLAAIVFMLALPQRGTAEAQQLLQPGDRVVLLGGAFIERMQTHGYLETELASHLSHLNLTFRNLGWSGDNVQGESRAVFGGIDDGYARLIRDLTLSAPSVVIVHYGVVEARAGPEGLKAFREQLLRLVVAIKNLDARVILLAPRPQVAMGPRFPDPVQFNKLLGLYRNAIKTVAESSNSAVVDLDVPGGTRLKPIGSRRSAERVGQFRAPFPSGLSADGFQLTAMGYWSQAPALARALGGERTRVSVRVVVEGESITASAGKIRAAAINTGQVSFSLQGVRLPRPLPPEGLGSVAAETSRSLALFVNVLAPGKYEIVVDGAVVGSYSARLLMEGVEVPLPGVGTRISELRDMIALKNEYFFHRYRPQNETYLFLFRKHEQGNNAVEIPMFDPLWKLSTVKSTASLVFNCINL
ncbi:MAG TPA: hypothetical protein EYN70_15150 [Planctomycetaceae bacterium]|nr:hypothetical protein [Planctomycetaceae bacterium]